MNIEQELELVRFEFIDEELYLSMFDKSVKFKDYSNQLWNDLTLEREIDSDVNDIAVKYKNDISALKQKAISYGMLGIRIVNEISRICIKHLEFVIKMSKKQFNNNKKNGNLTPKSGIFEIKINDETMEVICLSCENEFKKLFKCSKCLLAHYCGATCQKEDWKRHKKNCVIKNI